MERIMFATNPKWWKHNYVDPAADEKGEIIITPGSPEEFAQMAADWGLTDQDVEEIFGD